MSSESSGLTTSTLSTYRCSERESRFARAPTRRRDDWIGPTHRFAPTPKHYLNVYRMPPSASRVPAIYRETTICYAYMCSYAYGCQEKTTRPAQVLRRRCMRYLPDFMKIRPGLSDHALDLLARRRQRGEKLTSASNAVLDRFRPGGPMRESVYRCSDKEPQSQNL